MSERVEWITDRARFDAIAPQWDSLADAARLPFARHGWLTAWLDAFGPADLRSCVLWREDQLAAALPLRRTRAGAATIENVHTPRLQPLGTDMDAVMTLYRNAAAELGELVLSPVPSDLLTEVDLAAGARREGLLTVIEPKQTSPFVDTTGDLEGWRAESKPRWGAPLERFRRKAAREREAELTLLFAPSDLDAELAECFQVEASGWKGERGTAIISQPETERFYRGIAASFQRRGELSLSTLRLDGRLAAFTLCLLHRRHLYLLKTGYDETFRKLAPGLVLELSLIERCFEAEVDVYELLGGDTEWKLKFSTGTRDHVALRTFRRRPAGTLRYAYRRALRPGLRRAYQRLRSR